MSVYREAVPAVQVDAVSGADHAGAGAAVESVSGDDVVSSLLAQRLHQEVGRFDATQKVPH